MTAVAYKIPENRADKITLIELLEDRQKRNRERMRERFYAMFYDWQKEFCASTFDHFESCLCAANQIGKSLVGATIDSIHATGDYPDDYPGHRFNHAPTIWCLGYSMEKTRDILQKKLFGSYNQHNGFEGGLVPKDRILSWESATGTVNAMRTVRVKHRLGTAIVQFWSYTQGQHAIMGDVVDWIHVDEEPKDQTIRPQLLTRLINGDRGRGGRAIYTFTPENGRTELVIQFADNPTPDQFYLQVGWDRAPHITPERRVSMLAMYPEYQRAMRSEGEPMLGHGRIYDIADDFVLCDPFPIPDHWFVIGGMDFGYDHPQSFVKLVEDRDNDIIYITNSWKQRKVSANDAWGATKSWLSGVPVAWPPDGLQHEKGRDVNLQQKAHYVDAGFNMLPEHSTWPEGGVSVENGLYETLDRQRKGTYKIFRGQPELMEEHRQYHRDEKGKVVKIRDDILDAARQAYMMRRFAKRAGEVGQPAPHVIMPQPVGTMGGGMRGRR